MANKLFSNSCTYDVRGVSGSWIDQQNDVVKNIGKYNLMTKKVLGVDCSSKAKS